MTDDRKWLPDLHMDELSPPPRANPNDWIDHRSDGAFCLEPAEEGGRCLPLNAGDVVDFHWYEDLGSATFHVRADRTWEIDGEVPDIPEGGHLVIYEEYNGIDTLAYDMDEFAKAYIDNLKDHDLPVSTTIIFSAWSDKTTKFVFESADGGKFTPVPAWAEFN